MNHNTSANYNSWLRISVFRAMFFFSAKLSTYSHFSSRAMSSACFHGVRVFLTPFWRRWPAGYHVWLSISDGRNGYLVPVEDAKAAAERVAMLLESPELAMDMGQEARRTIEAQFTMKDVIRKLTKSYMDLL